MPHLHQRANTEALKPIRLSWGAYPTVQAALLAVMRNHEAVRSADWIKDYPADQLRHLWDDLTAIRNGIGARAMSDEEMEKVT